MMLRFLLCLSLAALSPLILLPGTVWADLAPVALGSALAAFGLILRDEIRAISSERRTSRPDRGSADRRPDRRRGHDRRARQDRRAPPPREKFTTASQLGQPLAIIDGSNVMYWRGGIPDIAMVVQVVARLTAHGLRPAVVFDANVGYKLHDRYLDDQPMANMLDLPVEDVLVVPRGQPADGIILARAQALGALVVTKDRYRDWAEAYPDVVQPHRLIRGGCRDGRLWLALPADASAEAQRNKAA